MGPWAIYAGERGATTAAALVLVLLELGEALAASAADAIYLGRAGAHGLGWQLALSSALLVVTLGVWGALADRRDRGRLLAGGAAIAAAVLVLLRLALVAWPTAAPHALLVVTKQLSAALDLGFWVLVADRFDARQARRVVPALAAAGGLGLVIGALATRPLALALGTEELLLLAAAAHIMAAFAALRLGGHAQAQARRVGAALAPSSTLWASWREAAAAVRSRALARRLAWVVALGGAAAPMVYAMLGFAAEAHYATEEALAGFYGLVRAGTHGATLAAQVLVAPLLWRRVGVAGALQPAPLVAVAVGLAFAGAPVLAVAVAAQAAARLVDATCQSPAEKLALNLLPAGVRGRVGAFLDGVAKRAGAVAGGAAAGLAAALGGAVALGAVAAAAGALWAGAAASLGRRYGALAVDALASSDGDRDGDEDDEDDDDPARALDEAARRALVADLAGSDDARAERAIARLAVGPAAASAALFVAAAAVVTIPRARRARLLAAAGAALAAAGAAAAAAGGAASAASAASAAAASAASAAGGVSSAAASAAAASAASAAGGVSSAAASAAAASAASAVPGMAPGAAGAAVDAAVAVLLGREDLDDAGRIVVARAAARLTSPVAFAAAEPILGRWSGDDPSPAVRLAAATAILARLGEHEGLAAAVDGVLALSPEARAAAARALLGGRALPEVDVAASRVAVAELVGLVRASSGAARTRYLGWLVAAAHGDVARAAPALDALAELAGELAAGEAVDLRALAEKVLDAEAGQGSGRGGGGGSAGSQAANLAGTASLSGTASLAGLPSGALAGHVRTGGALSLRAAAARFLAARPAETDPPRLARLLEDPDGAVRSAARRGLVTLGAPALPALLLAARYGRPRAREAALVALRSLRVAPAALEAVIDAELAALARLRAHGHVLAQEALADDAALAADAAPAPAAPTTAAPADATTLLVARLDERAHEVARALLGVVEARLAQPRVGIAAARWAEAADTRGRARALEALDALLPRGISMRVLPALEDVDAAECVRRAAQALGGLPAADAALVAELGGHDELARLLAVQALGRDGRAANRAALRAAAEAGLEGVDALGLVRRLAGGDERVEGLGLVDTMLALRVLPPASALGLRRLADLAARVRWLSAADAPSLPRAAAYLVVAPDGSARATAPPLVAPSSSLVGVLDSWD